MNIKTLIAVLLLVGMFACTQRTCPTYTKDELKQTEQSENTERKI
jgi:hypothetical protein